MPTKGVAPKQPKPRVRRLLASKEPQLVENTKKSLLMRGNSTSQLVTNLLTDIHRLKKPQSKLLAKRNDIHPFDNEQGLEFLCQKNDCSLFGLVSHSKKRPNNLVLGRTYEGHILDMFELGVNYYKGVQDFTGRSKKVGSKPCMLFMGDQWGYDEQFTRLQSLLIDFFRGDKVDKIALKGLDHVMVCTVADSNIYIRHYAITFKKSGTKVPNVELTPMGPHIDLVLRRTRLASADLWKLALKQPKGLKPAKVKNISHNSMGDKEGRLHLPRQDLSSMKVKRVKALRETSKRKQEGAGEETAPAKKLRA